MDSKPLQKGNKENNISSDIPKGLISSPETSKTSLQFDRLQPPKEACGEDNRLDFGPFTAREAVLDEEYWVSYNDKTKTSSMKNTIFTSFLKLSLLTYC